MASYKSQQDKLNELYDSYENMIDNIQNAIKREIPNLIHDFNLTIQQVDLLNEYIDDRLTMFRFLCKNNFNLPITLSLLLDTIRWRLQEKVDFIRLSAVSDDFLNKPFVYFYKSDKLNRPNLMIQLTNLPTTDIEQLTPLVIFTLETARLLLLDLSRQHGDILDINVLVDFKNATALPTDMELIKALVTLQRRYPELIGTVNLINFGWMYQGFWQMYKLVISNEAKSKVKFSTVRALKEAIHQDDLLEDFGGNDDFEWNLSKDEYFTKYRAELIVDEISPLSTLSRCSSSSTIFYDVINTSDAITLNEPIETLSVSLFNTPLAPLTPVANHENVAKVEFDLCIQPKLSNPVPPLHTRNDETVIPLKHKEIQQKPGIPSLPKGWIIKFMQKIEHSVRLMVLRTLKKLVKYKGTVYWILACVILRNGVQELCQHISLMVMDLLFVVKPSGAVGNAVGMRNILSLTMGQLTL